MKLGILSRETNLLEDVDIERENNSDRLNTKEPDLSNVKSLLAADLWIKIRILNIKIEIDLVFLRETKQKNTFFEAVTNKIPLKSVKLNTILLNYDERVFFCFLFCFWMIFKTIQDIW